MRDHLVVQPCHRVFSEAQGVGGPDAHNGDGQAKYRHVILYVALKAVEDRDEPTLLAHPIPALP